MEITVVYVEFRNIDYHLFKNNSVFLDTSYVRANEIALILAKGIKVKFPAK